MVEEEARCYLLHEDLRALEGRRTKGHLVAASAWVTGVSRKLRMHLDHGGELNDYCCIR